MLVKTIINKIKSKSVSAGPNRARALSSLVFIGLTLFSSVSFAAKKSNEPPPLVADVGFVNIQDLPAGTGQINPIRLQALRETAFTLGAQGALAWRALQINTNLKKEARHLDHVFDFNQLLIHRNVLPPVLVEADSVMNLDNKDAIRTASKIYRIMSPAQFVTTSPTWRTYLWMAFEKPSLPDKTLLPIDQVEAGAWNSYLRDGWRQGLNQADAIFSVNLNRLKRDYVGMVLYNKLLAQRIVSAPYVAQASLGVTGDSNEIRINDQISRITEHSKLQTDPSKWRAVIAP